MVLGYWIALSVFLGLSCYRRAIETFAAYEVQHPEDRNVLVIADSGWSKWVIVALVVLPPLALFTYHGWAKRRHSA